MKYALIPVLAVTLITSCANDPIIDKQGVDEKKYQSDLAQCQLYADQVDSPAEGAKQGAVGAAVGGALGAVLGNRHSAAEGVGAGAIFGSTRGVTEAEQRKQRVLFNCMKGRGYKVLG